VVQVVPIVRGSRGVCKGQAATGMAWAMRPDGRVKTFRFPPHAVAGIDVSLDLKTP